MNYQKKVIGIRQQFQRVGEIQEWTNTKHTWTIIIKNYLLTQKYDIQLEVAALTAKKIIKVNNIIKYSGSNAFTNFDVKFEINQTNEGRIKSIGSGLNYDLIINNQTFMQVFDPSYYYEPPSEIIKSQIKKEKIQRKPETQTENGNNQDKKLLSQKSFQQNKNESKKITSNSQNCSVFSELKKLKELEQQILLDGKKSGNKIKEFKAKGPTTNK